MVKFYDSDVDLIQIQNKIIDQLLVLTSIWGSLIVSLSLFGVWLYGARPTTAIHLLVFGLLVLLTLLRKWFRPKFKMTLVLLLLGLDIFHSIYYSGYISSAKIVLVVVPVFISFVYPFRKALYLLFLLVAIYSFLGYLFVTGQLVTDLDPNSFAVKPFAWVLDCAIILFSSFGLLYIGKTYHLTLLENSKLIKSQNTEILNRAKKFEVLFQSSHDAILLYKDQRFVDCNEKSLELFECSRDELIGKTPIHFSPDKQPGGESSLVKATQYLRKTYAGEPQLFEWVHSKANGETFHSVISLKLVRLPTEKYIQAVIRDITREKVIEKELFAYQDHLESMVVDRTKELEKANLQLSKANQDLQNTLDQLRQTQSQLIESEKMASVGVLTAGISHEINNPLNFILGGLYRLKDTFTNPEEYDQESELEDIRKETVEMIDGGVTRIRDIVKSLNHFNRLDGQAQQHCNVHVVLDNCLTILNHELSDKVVERNFSDKEIMLWGNDGKLHQVFLNLVHNASQATPEGGVIRICTCVSKDEKFGQITISDSGEGIPEEYLSKVFDPFFTTKPPGEGVGLGLFIVYQIVKDHNGTIHVESDKKGTAVIVEIPLE